MLKFLFSLFLIIISVHAEKNNALWVVRDALSQKNVGVRVVEAAKKMGINKLFVQVYALGREYYKTSPNTKPNQTNEALQTIIDEAHKNNMEVHAWLNCFFVYGTKHQPENREHIYWQAEGSILKPFRNAGGDKGVFLYPGDSLQQRALDKTIMEMILMYHVDGIHLDYFRYPDYEIPLSINARTDFKLKYFMDPEKILDKALMAKEGNYLYYKHFVILYRNFLSQKLTDALIHIKNTIKKTAPSVQLSIAVKPDPTTAKIKFLQPWESWLRNKYCDFVVAMNYSKEPGLFETNLRAIDRLKLADKIVIGIAVHNISKRVVLKRLNIIKNRNVYNFSLFSYNLLYQDKNLQNKIERLIHGNH